jgi:hypothetical protein
MINERIVSGIIEKIKKILAKTQDAGCPVAEAETAFAMASRLLAEHNLSMEDVHSVDMTDQEKFVECEVMETGRWSIENNLAFNIVRRFFFVEGFFSHVGSGKKVLHLFGTQSNVETARFTFYTLLSSADQLWTAYRLKQGRPGSEGRMFRTGVLKGFNDKMKDEREMQKMERDLMSGSEGGTTLVLVKIEDNIKKEMHKANPDLKKNTGPKFSGLQGDQSTLQAGYEAGKKLNLSRGINGKGQKGIR